MSIMQNMVSKSPIQFIANTTGTVPANSNTILTFSGHQTGDFLLAIAANGSSTVGDSAIYNNNGWTKIKSFANDGGGVGFRYSGVFYYKYASSTANEVLTLSTNITSGFGWPGSVGLIFRNVRSVGSSNVSNSTTIYGVTSVPTPTLTLSDTTTAKSMLVLSTYNFTANMSMSVTGMNTILNRGCLYGENRASWQGGNMTAGAGTSLYPCCGIVELLY